MSLFYVYVYVLYELFFIHNVVRMLSCVNTCACHVYFTINLLTYFWLSFSATLNMQQSAAAIKYKHAFQHVACSSCLHRLLFIFSRFLTFVLHSLIFFIYNL